MRINDHEALADACDSPDEIHDVRGVEVVEDSQAQYHVEGAVPVDAEVAHVIEDQFELVEPESLLGESRLLEVGRAPFGGNHAGALEGELDAELTFEASEVEDAKALDRLSGQVGGDLNKPPWPGVPVGLVERIDPVGETDRGTVGSPSPGGGRCRRRKRRCREAVATRPDTEVQCLREREHHAGNRRPDPIHEKRQTPRAKVLQQRAPDRGQH